MIHLTDKHIAVEIPEDATEVHLGNHCLGFKSELWIGNRDCNNWCIAIVRLGLKQISEIVGVTPLTEQQIHNIVGSQFTKGTTYCGDFSIPYEYNISPKDRWDDIQRLKRLDPNKKYAIIKFEKE